jgi:hypothetical protein
MCYGLLFLQRINVEKYSDLRATFKISKTTALYRTAVNQNT